MLLQIADNAFAKRPGTPSQEKGEEILCHLHMFRQYAESWVHRSLDNGPFVLIHGDREIFNLILDEDANIVSVLDWEWSRVVPR
jgi:aminoglycoside phosphotransferase (APT) family kinase protein